MSYKFLAKYGPTMAFGLFVVCCLISLIPIFSGLSDFYAVMPEEKRAFAPEGEIFLPGIHIANVLMWIAVVVTLVLSLWQVISNPKGSTKALISFGLTAVAFFIFYAMADPIGTGSLAKTIETFEISEPISKIIGGGLNLTILMLLGSVVVTILLEVWNYFKNQ